MPSALVVPLLTIRDRERIRPRSGLILAVSYSRRDALVSARRAHYSALSAYKKRWL